MQLRRYLQRPEGTSDFVLEDMAHRQAICSSLKSEFTSWGYHLVETPLLEYAATFAKGIHRGDEERLYRMFDASGRTLVVRPEMTTPVARIVASTLYDHPLPLRLYYLAKTYREHDGRAENSKEVTQAGIELVGDATPDGDAEVIALMSATLSTLGVQEFRIAVGHMGYVQAMLSTLPQEMGEALRNALIAKDLVSYVGILEEARNELSSETVAALLEMPRVRGGVDAIAKASQLALHENAAAACDDLAELWRVLEEQGASEYVHIDLGLYLNHEYYTGIVIEGYADSVGQPICFGGRYNHLLAQFGRPAPATGCVLHVERLMEIVKARPVENPYVEIFYEVAARPTVLRFCKFLRTEGLHVAATRVQDATNLSLRDGNVVSITCSEGQMSCVGDDRVMSLFQKFSKMNQKGDVTLC